MIDKLLTDGGIDAGAVHGYDDVAHGHLAAAYTIVSGAADACIATRSAAQTFGMDLFLFTTPGTTWSCGSGQPSFLR